MSTCGTCQHWKQPTPDADDYDLGVSDQSSEEVARTYGRCQRIVHIKDTPATDPAGTQDASGYRASIRCRTDFGCILHEPKV